MIIFSSPLSRAVLLLIFILHAAGQFTNGIISKIIKYANITLHIPMFLALIYLKAPIEEGLIFCMASLLEYLVFYLAAKKRRDKK